MAARLVLAHRFHIPDTPIIVYNLPRSRRGGDRAVDRRRLRRADAKHRRDQGDTRDFQHVSYVPPEAGRDFIALSGIELLCYPVPCLGGAGHVSCVGNFAPRPVAELYDAVIAGDHDRARSSHYDLHPLVDAAFAETNPVPAKWVMQELGLLSSSYAPEPLGDSARQRVPALLRESPHVEQPVAFSSHRV